MTKPDQNRNASHNGNSERVSGISVVIPAYNYAHFLERAIDSVLAQDHPRVEIIVVDDGSTDNTREVVTRYGDRVRYVHQQNAGLSAARNTGMRMARHEWIALLDADDEFMPGMLRRLAETLADLPAEFGLAACDCRHMGSEGGYIQKKYLTGAEPQEVLTKDILVRNRFVADAVLFRRDLALHAGGFDTTLHSSEDRDMWIHLSRHCRLYKIAEPLVRVRVHGGSMSRQAERMRVNMTRVLRKARDAGVAGRWNVFIWAPAYSFLFYQTAWMRHDAGEHWTAIGDLFRSLSCWPFFLNPHNINENHLFRVRSLLTFALWIVRNANRKQKLSGDGRATDPAGTSLTDKDG